MKKSLLALAALTAFTGVASAQSSVTLFGILDVAARNVKNGSAGSLKSISTDNSVTNRLGVRGTEDLGGGLRAGFWLESSVVTDSGAAGGANSTGNASAFWNRRSYVSLAGSFGEVRLGREYTPTFWSHTLFDPFSTAGIGSQLNLMGAAAGSTRTTTVRADNMITYVLPAMGGIYGQFNIAAGEGVDNNKYVGFRVGYAAGPLNVAFALGNTDTPIDSTKTWNIAGSYDMGFIKPIFQYHKNEYRGNSQTNLVLGGTAPMGAGLAKFTYGKASGFRSATQIALGYEHGLSRRTALFANVARLANKGNATFRLPGGPTTAATGITSTGYDFGVRHSF